MVNMKTKMRIVKTSFGILLLVIIVVSLAQHVSATSEYFSEFQKIYGNGSCTTCHFNSNGGGNLTGYGNKFAAQSNHFKDPASALRIIGDAHTNISTKMSTYVLALQGVYGRGSCVTCHVEPNGGELNKYGAKFVAVPNHGNDPIVALRSIGSPDENANVTTTTVKIEKKSPGFGTFVTIGIISLIYTLGRYKRRRK